MTVGTLHGTMINADVVAEVPMITGSRDRAAHDAPHDLRAGGEVDAFMEVSLACNWVLTPTKPGGNPVFSQRHLCHGYRWFGRAHSGLRSREVGSDFRFAYRGFHGMECNVFDAGYLCSGYLR